MKFTIGKDLKVESITCENDELFEKLYRGAVNWDCKENYNTVIKHLLENPRTIFKNPILTNTEFVNTLPVHFGIATNTVREYYHYLANSTGAIGVILSIESGDYGYYSITYTATRPDRINQAIRRCIIDEVLEVS